MNARERLQLECAHSVSVFEQAITYIKNIAVMSDINKATEDFTRRIADVISQCAHCIRPYDNDIADTPF